MLVDAVEGHRRWAPGYDVGPNPLLALETRLLAERLGPLENRIFLDVAAGTGRWMCHARSRGARALGFDLCREMLLMAAAKSGLAGRLALADARCLPIPNGIADLAVCSFALAYLPSVLAAVSELARVASFVIVSDLHPEAVVHGWTRGFRAGGQLYEIRHHPYSEAQLRDAADRAGLAPLWRIESAFGEPERAVFESAGKESLFVKACRIPAVLITAWRSQ
jgi:SAM-dependent methyltransferase